MQAKTYARSSESEKQNNDQSTISFNGTATFSDRQYFCSHYCELPYYGYSPYHDKTLSTDIALNLFLGIVLLTNTLLFILSLRYFHHAFNWLLKKERVKNSFFLSSIVVLGIINVSIVCWNTTSIHMASYTFSSEKVRAALVFNLLTAVMPMLEFVWITFKMCQYHNPQLSYYSMIAIFPIVLFAHRLLIDFIISVILFIIAPAQTIGIITLLLFTIFSAIIFLAQLYSIKCHCNWTTVSSLIFILVIGTISVVLVMMITLLYITFVENGLQSSGMGGFILSLIPTITGVIIGVYINRQTLDGFYKWCRSTSNSESDSTTTNDEQVDAAADGNINEGTH